MSSPDTDSSVGPLVRSFFREQCPAERVDAAEGVALAEDLWRKTEEMGLPGIGVDEAAGGSGGSVLDLVEVLKAQGAHAVPLPLAEVHLARWAAARTGLGPDPGLAVLTPGDPRDTAAVMNDRIHGRLHDVPWGRAAHRVLTTIRLHDRLHVLAVPTACTTVKQGSDLAGQPRDTLTMHGVETFSSVWGGAPNAIWHRALLLRGALMAGALEAVADLTRRYVTERVQFGRPIGKFQSVQEHVVHLEQMATMSLVAVDRAARAHVIDEDSLEPALMKLLLNENARLAVRAAHQAHGAIGMTREYPLQLLTRRLNSWLGEWGTSTHLAFGVGRRVTVNGIGELITRPTGAMEVGDA